MKRTLLLISTVLLSAMASVQTAMAQKVTLYSAGSKAYECDIAQLDSIVFSDASTVEPEEIVVTVDANGNADGGHLFFRIDEASFLIDDLKYTVQNDDLVVSGYDQAFFTGTANIISQLKYRGRTMNVVGIGNNAFYDCKILISVIIPNSVTSIGSSAFSSCSNLPSITIPNSVTSIGRSAFADCSSLTSIIIPNSVTSIGRSAFADCSSLTSVTIPNSVTSIEYFAFSGCTGLTSITIPNSVTSIAGAAFAECTVLASVIIPNSVTNIGDYAFSGCTSLTNVYCYAENVPSTSSSTFNDSSISSATLHVPAGSVDAYKAAEPWKYFKSIVAIE